MSYEFLQAQVFIIKKGTAPDWNAGIKKIQSLKIEDKDAFDEISPYGIPTIKDIDLLKEIYHCEFKTMHNYICFELEKYKVYVVAATNNSSCGDSINELEVIYRLTDNKILDAIGFKII